MRHTRRATRASSPGSVATLGCSPTIVVSARGRCEFVHSLATHYDDCAESGAEMESDLVTADPGGQQPGNHFIEPDGVRLAGLASNLALGKTFQLRVDPR